MFLRIVLTLALLGTILFGGAYYFSSQTVISLKSDLDTAHTEIKDQKSALIEAEKDKQKLQVQLLEMDTDLGATKTKLTSTEAARVQLDRANQTLSNRLSNYESHEKELVEKITLLNAKLLEAKASQTSQESVATYRSTIAELEKDLAEAKSKRVAPPVAPDKPEGLLLSTNRARNSIVVSVGPSSAFVVINYGASHGALPTQTVTIKRGTEIMAKALISDVRENYSIAQIQPKSLRGDLHKGDSALLAH